MHLVARAEVDGGELGRAPLRRSPPRRCGSGRSRRRGPAVKLLERRVAPDGRTEPGQVPGRRGRGPGPSRRTSRARSSTTISPTGTTRPGPAPARPGDHLDHLDLGVLAEPTSSVRSRMAGAGPSVGARSRTSARSRSVGRARSSPGRRATTTSGPKLSFRATKKSSRPTTLAETVRSRRQCRCAAERHRVGQAAALERERSGRCARSPADPDRTRRRGRGPPRGPSPGGAGHRAVGVEVEPVDRRVPPHLGLSRSAETSRRVAPTPRPADRPAKPGRRARPTARP